MNALPPGRHYFRGDDGYEDARRATVWNRRVPDRYPEVIVQAADVDDVVATVAYARVNGHRVGIRSGGHSWAANHLRDGGVLLDVHGLDHCAVDTERKVAVVGPGRGGSVLAGELDARGLFFPAGHCKGVCIGGYLLQGGYGWNSRVLGPACESVIGLDVATGTGSEMRSRFWLGGPYISVRSGPGLADRVVRSVASRILGASTGRARDLMVHCAQEMNHLAGFLPALYEQFGNE